MAKNNKTAVEWLIDQLKGRYDIDIEKLTVCAAAKEIEREQIIDAWQDAYLTGCVVGSNDYTNENEETDNGAYYYNQTYNQNK